MLTKKNYQSPLGEITLLSDETYLLGVWFKEQKYFAANYDLKKSDFPEKIRFFQCLFIVSFM